MTLRSEAATAPKSRSPNAERHEDGAEKRVQKPGLREKNKALRRTAILDAAEQLIVESGATSFTMSELASRAGLSHHTAYNLIGSKATVLFMLLNRCIDRFATFPENPSRSDMAISHLIQSGDAAAAVYTANPDLYRPLIRFFFGVPDEMHRPLYMERAYRFWLAVTDSLEPLCPDGVFTPADIARDINLHFTGAMELWVHCELTSPQLHALIKQGICLRLLSLEIGQDVRASLHREISDTAAVLEGFRPGERQC